MAHSEDSQHSESLRTWGFSRQINPEIAHLINDHTMTKILFFFFYLSFWKKKTRGKSDKSAIHDAGGVKSPARREVPQLPYINMNKRISALMNRSSLENWPNWGERPIQVWRLQAQTQPLLPTVPLHLREPGAGLQGQSSNRRLQTLCGDSGTEDLESQLCMMDLCLQQFTGLHEDAFHGLPVVVLTWLGHTMYLLLSTYRSAILFSRDRQENFGGRMFESHFTISHPVRSITEHCPVIQIVTFTFLAKGTHFLKDRKW